MFIDEGDKRRCADCRRRVHKDESLKHGCLICTIELIKGGLCEQEC